MKKEYRIPETSTQAVTIECDYCRKDNEVLLYIENGKADFSRLRCFSCGMPLHKEDIVQQRRHNDN